MDVVWGNVFLRVSIYVSSHSNASSNLVDNGYNNLIKFMNTHRTDITEINGTNNSSFPRRYSDSSSSTTHNHQNTKRSNTNRDNSGNNHNSFLDRFRWNDHYYQPRSDTISEVTQLNVSSFADPFTIELDICLRILLSILLPQRMEFFSTLRHTVAYHFTLADEKSHVTRIVHWTLASRLILTVSGRLISTFGRNYLEHHAVILHFFIQLLLHNY